MSLISLRAAGLLIVLCPLVRLLPAGLKPWALLAGAAAFFASTPELLALHVAHTALTLVLAAALRRGAQRRRLLPGAIALECGAMLLLRGRGGFSFAALLHIGFLLDAARAPTDAPVPLQATALSFFPILQEGPVADAEALSARLRCPEPLTWPRGSRSALRIVTGLIKKLVVADRLAGFVDAAFSAPESCSGAALWLALLAYAVQVYMDFSGCMDVVLGYSALLGIDLPENFQRPYFADSCADYWRRWHMSMGAWFRRRCFYPIAASRPMLTAGSRLSGRFRSANAKRAAVVALPLLITWAMVGLWHGLAAHYLVWGLANGLAILLGHLFESPRKRLPKPVRIARTFILVSLIRVLFRAGSLRTAGAYYLGLARFGGGQGWALLPGRVDLAVAGLFTALLMALEWWAERRGERTPSVALALVLTALGIAAVVLLGRYGPGYSPVEFYYNRF